MAVHAIPVGADLAAIDVCAAGCGGIWLDDADIRMGLKAGDHLKGVVLNPCRTPDCSQSVPCPVCARNMLRYRWNYSSPVLLDQCPDHHGTWIDHGEVEAIRGFIQSEAAVPYVPKRRSWAPPGDLREIATESLWEVGGWCVWDVLESAVDHFGSSD